MTFLVSPLPPRSRRHRFLLPRPTSSAPRRNGLQVSLEHRSHQPSGKMKQFWGVHIQATIIIGCYRAYIPTHGGDYYNYICKRSKQGCFFLGAKEPAAGHCSWACPCLLVWNLPNAFDLSKSTCTPPW
jgi:hypothetical protein